MTLTVYHWILIAAFVGIVVWAFGRKRKARFERQYPVRRGEGLKVKPGAEPAQSASAKD